MAVSSSDDPAANAELLETKSKKSTSNRFTGESFGSTLAGIIHPDRGPARSTLLRYIWRHPYRMFSRNSFVVPRSGRGATETCAGLNGTRKVVLTTTVGVERTNSPSKP